ncbi:hypothetical protein [Mycobacterium sp. E1386]|uniref:hypothetical protein n=1 Tax=Mycobacterium sp. E1386 TaxID=1834126 RepID=UPI0012EA897B|nr:hypothetical protein [Mycobacterium sp. E1386]
MSLLSSALTVVSSGAFAAAVTFAANWWLLRPRASLRIVRSGQTLEDADRLFRAKNPNQPGEQVRAPWHWLRVTNYGDAPAYDLELIGKNCRPRTWVADTGQSQTQDDPPEVKWPMWDRKLAALPAGESVQVVLMCVQDERNSAQLKVSWHDMPGRSKRRSTSYSVKDQRGIETGWPGMNPDL